MSQLHRAKRGHSVAVLCVVVQVSGCSLVFGLDGLSSEETSSRASGATTGSTLSTASAGGDTSAGGAGGHPTQSGSSSTVDGSGGTGSTSSTGMATTSSGSSTGTTSTSAGGTGGSAPVHHVFALGGRIDNQINASPVVYASTINADGSLGDWFEAGQLGAGRSLHGTANSNGHLYLVGGEADDFVNDAVFATPDATGITPVWATTAAFATKRYRTAATAANGFIYSVAGMTYNGVALDDVQFAAVQADGSLGSWSTTTSLPDFRHRHGTTAHGNLLYVLGGSNKTTSYTNDVFVSELQPDGQVGPWTSVSPFSGARMDACPVSYGGRLYVIGGYGNTQHLSEVQLAEVLDGDGNLGTWTATSSLGLARAGMGCVALDGFVYVAGGRIGPSDLVNASVEFAPILSDGTLGPWTPTTALPEARGSFGLQAL